MSLRGKKKRIAPSYCKGGAIFNTSLQPVANLSDSIYIFLHVCTLSIIHSVVFDNQAVNNENHRVVFEHHTVVLAYFKYDNYVPKRANEKFSEHLPNTVDTFHEGIDLFFGIIKGETGSNGAFDTKTMHQGFGTMMTCADSDAQSVE